MCSVMAFMRRMLIKKIVNNDVSKEEKILRPERDSNP